MKKSLSIICLVLGFIGLKSQNTELDKLPVEVSLDKFTAKEVGYMAVFPGCEKTNKNDKEALQNCLAIELNKLMADGLSDFAEQMEKRGDVLATAKLQFVIDTQGKITEIEALPGGDSHLGNKAVQAMERIAKKIKYIQPATLKDGTQVKMVFQLPLRYLIQSESMLSKIPWNEYVIATIFDENKKYELRHDKNFVFKIYDVIDGNNKFLQKFNTLEEVDKTEPYATLIQSQSEKLMMAEKKVGNIFYRIYYNQQNPNLVDIYKIISDKEVFVDTLNKNSLQYVPEYIKIVLRK